MQLVVTTRNFSMVSEFSNRVPRRFGISGILAITTTFGLLFGGLRYLGASPPVYLFFASQAILICMLQMSFGSIPRGISAAAGAVFLPLWFMGYTLYSQRMSLAELLLGIPFAVALGALFGYCIGTLAAGVFLLLDMMHTQFRRTSVSQEPLPPQASESTPRID